MDTKELTLKLDRARWYCLREYPFYGTLAMGLVDRLDTSIKTACTDGKVIKWNPDFLAGLSDEETRFVVLHETMHPAHGHLWRLPLDHRGNMAGDYAINATLSALPGLTMPKGGLLNQQFDGLAEEEILARLPDDPPGNGQGSSTGDFEAPADQQPSKSDPNAADGQGDAPGDSLQDQWERRVIQAQQAAQATQGNTPADMQRILDRIRVQDIDWRRETADFVRDVISTRNDWSRPARRHAWQPVIYPRRRADQIGKVILVRDSSGSITDQLCAEFTAHGQLCLAEINATGLLMDCDTEIHLELEIAPGDDCPLHAIGGGGTDFSRPFERAQELIDQGEHIAGLIYLTDCEGTFGPPPEFPTLWLNTSRTTAPFGRTIHIKQGA